jgi:hypothetical protein
MTPRFFFQPDPEPSALGATLLENASHCRIDLYKCVDGELHIQFEISGGLNGDGDFGQATDEEDRRKAVGTIRELVRMFAAKGGA